MGTKKNNKKKSVQFKDLDNIQIATIKMTDEVAKNLGIDKNDNSKNAHDYLRVYLGIETYDEACKQFDAFITKTIPEESKLKCKVCNGNSKSDNDRLCSAYKLEGGFNFLLNANNFVQLVINHKDLFNDEDKFNLSILFFESFSFQNGRVWFDEYKMKISCLHKGFEAMSKFFSKNNSLNNLQIINGALDTLSTRKLNAEMYLEPKCQYLNFQDKFFKQKRKYFKEEVDNEIREMSFKNLPSIKSHEKLFEVVILSTNKNSKLPIEGAYELLKETWFFLNSDEATFNGKEIEKGKRPLLVNPMITGKPNFNNFFDSVITYNSIQDNIELIEQDFINDFTQWIETKRENNKFSTAQKRKFNEFLEYLNNKDLKPVQANSKKESGSVLKPTINKEVAEIVFELLKGFFEIEQQKEFKKVLNNLSNAKAKLVFRSNGNQLSDTFKKLVENHFIVGFQKTDLIEWIFTNFQFVYRGNIKDFKIKTLEQTISGTQTPCKNPIIEIKNREIVKIDK